MSREGVDLMGLANTSMCALGFGAYKKIKPLHILEKCGLVSYFQIFYVTPCNSQNK